MSTAPSGRNKPWFLLLAWVTWNGWFRDSRELLFLTRPLLSCVDHSPVKQLKCLFLSSKVYRLCGPRPITLPCVWLQVLDAGRIQEYDEPYVLLQNQEGVFYQTVQQTGKAEAASLLHAAKQVTDPTNPALLLCPNSVSTLSAHSYTHPNPYSTRLITTGVPLPKTTVSCTHKGVLWIFVLKVCNAIYVAAFLYTIP